MSSTEPRIQDRLGIVELGEVCARMRARDLDLFEQLGAWVMSTPDPASQRLFATACHRHAWHAQLWAERAPAVPPVDVEALTASHRSPADDVPGGERLAGYRAALASMLAELDRLRSRFDPDLDPSTDRTITLVRADVRDLLARIDRLG